MNIKNLNEGFMRKYMKAVNEDFNPLEGLRSNIIEFPNGEVVYIGYENGKLFAGSATNTGIIHEFEIDYDRDASVNENICELYDTIVENNPSYLYEPENESVKAGPSHKVNEAKNPSKDDLEPRQRTAVDGVTYWVVYDKANKKYSTLTCFGKYKTKKKAQDAIDSCKLLESKKLTEGASNFWSMEDLPLLVFDDYDTVYDRVYDMTKEQLGDDAEDIDDTPEFEKNWDEYYDYCVLDEDGQKSLQDDIDSFNKTCKYADDFDEYEYALVEVEIKSGYYEAAQLYCDTTNIGDTQLEKVKQFFDEMKKKYGLTQLGVSYRASNGETGYHKVNEASETGRIVTVCPECGYKNRARVTFPALNKPFDDTGIDCVNCGTKLKVHDEHKYNDDGTIEESNLPKVQKQLARADSGDKDIARDLALIIENDGDIYRRSVTPAIENLKKKVAKGSFDKTLAVQMFYNVVMNALNDKTFRTYFVHDTDVPTRYLAAKYLLDYFSDDIGIDETITEKNLTRSERHNRTLNRVFDQKKKFDKKYAGFLISKGYSKEQIDKLTADDKLSDEIAKKFVKKGEQPSVLLGKILDGSLTESKRGFVKKYCGCSIHDACDVYVVTDEHGTTIGQSKMMTGAESIAEEHAKKTGKKCESKLSESMNGTASDVVRFMYKNYPDADFIGEGKLKDRSIILKFDLKSSYRNAVDAKKVKESLTKEFGDKIKFGTTKAEYAPEIKSFAVIVSSPSAKKSNSSVDESFEDSTKYLEGELASKTSFNSIKNAYERNDLTIIQNGNAYYFERCPNSIINKVKSEMKKFYPDLKFLYDESCKNVNEAKRGFIRKYKGCSLHDAGDKIVVTDEHGKNIGEERTESAAEGVIDSYIAKKTKATESLHEDVDVPNEDRIKALAEYLDVSADEISKTYGHEFETPDGDYLVCDENEARELADEDINNSIDEMGIKAFSEDFQEWIKDNALDTDWFDSVMRESYESYVKDIESDGDSTYDNRLIQEMYDADILTDDDFVADGDDIDYTQLKEDVDIDSKKSDFVDYLCGQQGDPVEWYRYNFGEKELTDTIKSYDYILDRDAIVDECIAWDGVSHFIATYDGDEIELGNNLYAYRTN